MEDINALIESIEYMCKVPMGWEDVQDKVNEKVQKLFLLLPSNINSVQTENGKILHREEYYTSIPTLSSLKKLILPTEQTKELKE